MAKKELTEIDELREAIAAAKGHPDAGVQALGVKMLTASELLTGSEREVTVRTATIESLQATFERIGDEILAGREELDRIRAQQVKRSWPAIRRAVSRVHSQSFRPRAVLPKGRRRNAWVTNGACSTSPNAITSGTSRVVLKVCRPIYLDGDGGREGRRDVDRSVHHYAGARQSRRQRPQAGGAILQPVSGYKI